MYVSIFTANMIRYASAIVAGFFIQRAFMRLATLPLSRKLVGGVSRGALIWIMFAIVFMTPSWIGDENPILLFPVFLTVLLLCTGGDRLGRLVLGGIFYALLIPTNMIVDTFVDLKFYSYNYTGMENILPMLLKCGIWIILAWLILRTAPTGGLHLARRQWLLLGGLMLAPLMSMLSLSFWNNKGLTEEFYSFYNWALERIAFSVLPFVVLSSLALLFSAVRFSRQETLEHEAQMATLREIYYDGVKQEQTQVRTLRHDLRNHLTALQGLLARGETQQAQDYAAQLAQSSALIGGARLCENEVANIVLSGKAAGMEASGVTPDFSVSLPEPLPLPAPELCALFGNALDNALEAAQKAEDKTVLLRARADKGVLMLRVENALNAPLRRAELKEKTALHAERRTEQFVTTKADVRAHGFGLAGMRDIAERHGGTLEATAENGRFTLLVCVPLPQACDCATPCSQSDAMQSL